MCFEVLCGPNSRGCFFVCFGCLFSTPWRAIRTIRSGEFWTTRSGQFWTTPAGRVGTVLKIAFSYVSARRGDPFLDSFGTPFLESFGSTSSDSFGSTSSGSFGSTLGANFGVLFGVHFGSVFGVHLGVHFGVGLGGFLDRLCLLWLSLTSAHRPSSGLCEAARSVLACDVGGCWSGGVGSCVVRPRGCGLSSLLVLVRRSIVVWRSIGHVCRP